MQFLKIILNPLSFRKDQNVKKRNHAVNWRYVGMTVQKKDIIVYVS